MSLINFGYVDGTWDEPVYIIGGGTSLKDFDWDRLKDKFTLGVNKAAWIKNTNAFFTLDSTLARQCYNEMDAYIDSGGDAYLALPSNENATIQHPDATYVVRITSKGLSGDRQRIFGTFSGYGALGLCYLKKAPEVYLLGFDMVTGKEGHHWHDGYRWQNDANRRYYPKWAEAFDHTVKLLEQSNIKVYNCVGVPESNVTAFEKIPLDNI